MSRTTSETSLPENAPCNMEGTSTGILDCSGGMWSLLDICSSNARDFSLSVSMSFLWARKNSFSAITAESAGNKPHSSRSSYFPALPQFASSRTLCPLKAQRELTHELEQHCPVPLCRRPLRAGAISLLSLGLVAHLGLSSQPNSAHREILSGWGLPGQKLFEGSSAQATCSTEQD